MGAPAALLLTAHIAGCTVVAWLGWLIWALSTSEGNTPGSDMSFLVLGAALIVTAVVMSLALVKRRRGLAALLVALELAIGVALVMRGLDLSVHSDEWVYLIALLVGLTGVGAIAAAQTDPS